MTEIYIYAWPADYVKNMVNYCYTLLFIYFIIYEYFVNTINNFTEHKYIEKRIRVIMV